MPCKESVEPRQQQQFASPLPDRGLHALCRTIQAPHVFARQLLAVLIVPSACSVRNLRVDLLKVGQIGTTTDAQEVGQRVSRVAARRPLLKRRHK